MKGIEFGSRTYIMGILNVTPDSFSGDGIYQDVEKAVEIAERLVEDGADIIDIGGESTRPGAEPVTIEEEIKRAIPVIKKLSKRINIPISIDTSKPEVARFALESGASIVNDITGLGADSKMIDVVREFSVKVVVMHTKGTPQTMQNNPEYGNLILEIKDKLNKKEYLLGIRAQAIKPNRQTKNDIIIKGIIELAEVVGSDTELHFKYKDFRLLGLSQKIESYQIGNTIDLFIDLSKFCIFDKDTKRLVCRVGGEK